MKKFGNRYNRLKVEIAFSIPKVITVEYFNRFREYTDDYDKDRSVERIYLNCKELSDILDEELGIEERAYGATYRLNELSTLVDAMLESKYRLYYNDDEYYFLSKVQYDRETKVFKARITCKRR